MSEKKHWTHFLPEANQIKKDGERAFKISMAIEYAKLQIIKLEKQLHQEEKLLLNTVRMQWNETEILEAKQKSELQ
jgi:hypothetical protein